MATSHLSALTEAPVWQPKEGAENKVNSLPQRGTLIGLPAVTLHSIASDHQSQWLLTVSPERVLVGLAQRSTSERGWQGSLLPAVSAWSAKRFLDLRWALCHVWGDRDVPHMSHRPAGSAGHVLIVNADHRQSGDTRGLVKRLPWQGCSHPRAAAGPRAKTRSGVGRNEKF